MGKLFGTDGVRGAANTYPMVPEMALRMGRAIASVFSEMSSRGGKIVIGKDTRLSCTMLEYALVSGICAMGSDVWLTGILPTPGIAHITTRTDADAGVVISASHNPYYDNGIKIFTRDGCKLSDEIQAEIERLTLDEHNADMSRGNQHAGTVKHVNKSGEKYTEFLTSAVPADFSLKGMKIVLDCANGATYDVAPKLFNSLGADVITISAAPDGRNINDRCGSQHPENIAGIVLKENAQIGLAFDGDGDRLIAVDDRGKTVSGDQILAVCAAAMKKQNKLNNDIVVSTIMSNIGLGLALEKMGVQHAVTDVGDRYVIQEMTAQKAAIGGEDSGHLIFMDHHSTGDGILAGLKLLETLQYESRPLSKLTEVMTVYPQELINVDVASKPDISTVPDITAAIQAAENELGDKGRVLVRYSGTQSKCRVMVEGPTRDVTARLCQQIADTVKGVLG